MSPKSISDRKHFLQYDCTQNTNLASVKTENLRVDTFKLIRFLLYSTFQFTRVMLQSGQSVKLTGRLGVPYMTLQIPSNLTDNEITLETVSNDEDNGDEKAIKHSHVRFTFWYIFLWSRSKQQRKIIKFKVLLIS